MKQPRQATPPKILAPAKPGRWPSIDALRGLAVVQMLAFHFCYDLSWFGWAAWNTKADLFWIVWRNLIVTQFLLICGVSIALRSQAATHAQQFWQRWGQIAGAACLVSIGSYVAFPRSYIYFGVLHCVAAALILTLPLLRLRQWNAVIGAALIGAGLTWQHAAFTPKTLNWIGFMPGKPITEDYVPLVPWLGVVLVGLALGNWISATATPTAIRRPPAKSLIWLGQHSLAIYLIHQPLFIALLWGLKQALP